MLKTSEATKHIPHLHLSYFFHDFCSEALKTCLSEVMCHQSFTATTFIFLYFVIHYQPKPVTEQTPVSGNNLKQWQ